MRMRVVTGTPASIPDATPIGAATAGQQLGVRTAGTGTNSATTPLVAVGNQPCNGTESTQVSERRVQLAAGPECSRDSGWKRPTDAASPSRRTVRSKRASVWATRRKLPGWRPRAVACNLGRRCPADHRGFRTARPVVAADGNAYLADADFGEIILAERITQPTQGRTPHGCRGTYRLWRETDVHAAG